MLSLLAACSSFALSQFGQQQQQQTASCADSIRLSVSRGELASGRAAALAYAKTDKLRRKECAKAWVEQTAALEATPKKYFELVRAGHATETGGRNLAAADIRDCWRGEENWLVWWIEEEWRERRRHKKR